MKLKGTQIAQREKVAGVVPHVENSTKNRGFAPRYAESCNLPWVYFILDRARSADFGAIFSGSIDFVPGVGYANQTFAAYPRNDNWGISWNGQHLLLKKFA